MPTYRIKQGGMHDQFHRCRTKIQVIGGGFGNGKSAALCIKAIKLALAYPGSNGFIGMATYSQLNDTIREEYYKWLPNSQVARMPTVSDNTLIYKNGSKVNFRYLQQKGKTQIDGSTSSNLLSATYDYACVDQMENPTITYKDYLDLLGRLRGQTAYKGDDPTMPEDGPRWLIMTANPAFNWFFKKIIEPAQLYRDKGIISPVLPVNSKGEVLISLFEAPTQENSDNLPEDFIEGMKANYHGKFADRFIGGEWGAFDGLIYENFDNKFHLLSQTEMKSYLLRLKTQGITPRAIIGLDYGIASPTCLLFGFVDHQGRVFFLDGFYKPGLRISDIVSNIVTIFRKWSGLIDTTYPIMADPAIFRRTHVAEEGGRADTIADMLRDDGGLYLLRGQNDITSGIAKVHSYISVRDFPHYLTGDNNGALIYFADHLTFLIEEFNSYFWQTDKGLDRIDKPVDRNDHAMDALKYAFSELPEVARLRIRRKTLEDIYRELI